MGITFRNGVGEIGIKTVDEVGIDETGSYPLALHVELNIYSKLQLFMFCPFCVI